MKLTAKQTRFVQEYMVDLNATQAAIRAGYSKKTANRIASENLSKLDIQIAIQEAQKARQKRTEVAQDYVIGKLKEITDKDASDCQDSDLKYSSKIRALELLGKHLNLFDRQGSKPAASENNLLSAILAAGEVDVSDLPEVE